ncbi:MAG: hypothetical protein O7A06_16185 [Acidobacteria bacterium]|nr:hypothetical protein [Acidobacteriota bacterium]MCZ6751271.1 hypothetical protein [Acidobacteriota bacterium]
MAHPQIAAFARLAEGNAKPTRSIAGQKTLITRTIHDLAYDPIRDEIVVPQFYAHAILTFRGDANGNEAPIRIIQGPDTKLSNPMALALDPVHNEIFVPSEHPQRILVFPREAEGNVAPIRILEGQDTQLDAARLAVDPAHNLLIVSGNHGGRGSRRGGQLLIFNRTDEGNTKPKAIIRGPNSQLRSALLEVYPPRGLILAAIRGRGRASQNNFVGVWSIHDNGDVPPRWTIGGPNGMLRQIRGVTLDAENKNVIISDKFLNAILTYHFPEIF